MEYLLIDGYNIINSWNDVFNPGIEPLEDCRERLLKILSNYQGYKNITIIVVFDAHLVKGNQGKQESYDNLTVVYTKENETADNYIERFVHELSGSCTVRVATSDYLEQTLVLANGGVRISPRELKEDMDKVVKDSRGFYKEKFTRMNSIMSNIKPEHAKELEKIRRGKF